MNTAGKVFIYSIMPFVEEIEIYFTAGWDDVVIHEIDFLNHFEF